MIRTAATLAALLTATSPMAQQEPSTETFDITALTCFDVISLPEEDAIFLTGMLVGYATSTAGTTETSAADIVAKVEAFDTTCGENPDMPALEALS